MSLGNKLRELREARELTLDQVSRETCIRDDFLEAVEEGDLDKLPSGSVKQIIAAFAECVGLDEEELAAHAQEQEQEDASNADESDEPEAEVEDTGVVPEAAAVVADMREELIDRPRREEGLPRGLVVIAGGLAALAVFGLLAWALMPAPSGTTVTDVTPEPISEVAASVSAPQAAPMVDEPVSAEPVTPQVETPSVVKATPMPVVESPTPGPVAEPAFVPSADVALRVSESGVGLRVVKLQLEGRADTFQAGATVNFWTRVVDGAKGDTIRHVWLHEGKPQTSKALAIGGSHWRTYSQRTVTSQGQWTVQAVDQAGNLLAEHEFTCKR